MSNYLNMEEIVLVGTGPMATDYAAVLRTLRKNFTVVGRGAESATAFHEKTGVFPFVGGLDKFLSEHAIRKNSYAIIATGTEALMPALIRLLESGIEKILIEKPAAISIEELLDNTDKLEPYQDRVFVAYNRRFYASVLEAKEIIRQDGGLQSMHFEFTEWAHKIEPLKKADGVKENWFFANSTHVVDLAFYMAGEPKDWNCFSRPGQLTWHPKTNFSGAGITDQDVLFSYISNWESAGRWALELLTSQRRIYLKPLEEIAIQQKGSVALENHLFDSTLDKEFKPGLYRQTEAFINGNDSEMLTLKAHIIQSKNVFSKILK